MDTWDVYVSADDGPESVNHQALAAALREKDLGGEVISGPSAGPRSFAFVIRVAAPTKEEACAIVAEKVRNHVGDSWIVGARPDDEA